jgi:hypothetical protein
LPFLSQFFREILRHQIADSISEQHFEHLLHTLPSWLALNVTQAQEEVLFHYVPEKPHIVSGSATVHLLPSSDAERLLAKAGVPEERIERPILTYVRDDMLLPLDRVTKLVARIAEEHDEEARKRISNVVLGEWRSALRRNTEPLVLNGGKVWLGVRDTVLVLNSGTHWSPPCLLGFSREQILEGYRAMVNHSFSARTGRGACSCKN